jgi:hypothetical protein
MKQNRKHIWIDSFQTGLLVRIAAYCIIFQLAAWAFSTFCEELDSALATMGVESKLFYNSFARGLVALLIVVPPLTIDAVRFAHRFVGPLYRFRKTIQAMAAGEEVSLVKLRKDDLLMEFKDDFNAMLQYLEQQGYVLLQAPAPATTTKAPQPVNGREVAAIGPEAS